MTLRRMFGVLVLVMSMGMLLVLLRAEEMRVGRELEEARRLRTTLGVQYERIACERSARKVPSYVTERVVAMGLAVTWPSGSEISMLAKARR
ncbi:MAG: hypothetical protein V2A58_14620 [Planctomycetota bacterium]